MLENLYKNFYFVGFIDLILKDKKTGKYIIIDWKTSTLELNVEEKFKDEIFLSQMRFYKYFYSIKFLVKNKINISNINKIIMLKKQYNDKILFDYKKILFFYRWK